MSVTAFLTTPRLAFRELVPADAAALSAIMGDSRVMAAWGHAFGAEEIRAWIADMRSRYGRDGCAYWALTLRPDDTGRLVGQAGLLRKQLAGMDNPLLEVAWILGFEHWHKGYATEAGRACVDLAFRTFGEDRVHALIRPENTASSAVAVRLGMHRERAVSVPYRGQLLVHDVWVLERSQWEATCGSDMAR